MKKITLPIMFAILLYGCIEDKILSYEKGVTYISSKSAYGDSLTAKGRWASNSKMPFQRLSFVNSVYLECYKRKKVCREELALLYTKQDQDVINKIIPVNSLQAISFQYHVTQWTRSTITALYAAPAADMEIRINIDKELVERIYRETSSRGAEGSNPATLLWVLE